MTRDLVTWFVLLVVALFAAVLFGLLSPIWGVRVAAIGGVAMASYLAVTTVLSRFDPPPRMRRRRRARPAQTSPAYLARVESRIEGAAATVVGYEPLRRRFEDVAEHRLARHGFELESEGGRRLLGDEAWELLQEPAPADRFRRGPGEAQLRRVVERLEAL